MLKIHSPLSDDVEQLIHNTIGCCIRVHRELGPGLFERVYAGALCVELKATGITFEREKRYVVSYRGEAIRDQYLDLVVGNQVVLELKSVDALAPLHHQQILSYMRVARLRAGLLVNFNVALLPEGLSRKIL
jgi:GxxExxY protein